MRRFACLLLLGGLTACASGGAARSVALGQSFTMQPGERVTLPGTATLRYVELVNDSRCPPDVQCIRAGDATLAFEFTRAGDVATKFTLNTDTPTSAPIGDWQLHLLALARGEAPSATVRVDAR